MFVSHNSRNIINSLPLKTKIPLTLALTIAVFVGIFSLGWNKILSTSDLKLKDDNTKQLGDSIDNMLSYSMENGDMQTVQQAIRKTADAESILSISLIGREGLVFYSSDSTLDVGSLVTDAVRDSLLRGVSVIDKTNLWEGSIVYAKPKIFSEQCSECHDAKPGDTIGALVLQISSEDVLANSRRNTLMLILTIIGMSLIVGVCSYVVVYFLVVKRIRAVSENLKDIAQGEGDLTKRLEIKQEDELGELAKWFNSFVQKVHEVIQKIRVSSQNLANSSNELSATSEQLAAGAEEQQAQLSEIATSMEEMSAMILQASKNANATHETTGEANSVVSEGKNSVKETIRGMEDIAAIVASTSSQISSLESKSKEIGEVIQVIEDIADQTNLLALNANIEAARAGDAGRGFAVVADEVRKLAERTVNATSEIGEKIREIQQGVMDSVSGTAQITDRSDKGRQLASQSGSALDKISVSIEEVNNAVEQIANAADQQSTGAEEISRNIENISSVAKEAAGGSQGLAFTSEALNKEVQTLNGLISQFKI
ncbi:MAG: HAMP domain-containing protein [FCB group bacterium]|nr:HAMP domain-containing protein [FCB group bacterium]